MLFCSVFAKIPYIYSLYLIELDRILFKHVFDIIVGFNGLLRLEYIYLFTGKFCKQKPNLFYDEFMNLWFLFGYSTIPFSWYG